MSRSIDDQTKEYLAFPCEAISRIAMDRFSIQNSLSVSCEGDSISFRAGHCIDQRGHAHPVSLRKTCC